MSDLLEKKLLGKLLDPNNIAEAWEIGIRGEHFVQPLYQAVWNTTVEYWRNSQMKSAPTLWVLQQEYSGYTPELNAPEEIEYLCDLLRRRYAANELQDLLKTAAETSNSDPVGTLKTLTAQVMAASESMTNRITRVNMADNIEDREQWDEVDPDAPLGDGVPYGIDMLDALTGGIAKGEVATVGGYAKTGKTMFLLNAAAAAVRQGFVPIVFSMELSLKATQKRLDAMFSGISYNRIEKKLLTAEDKGLLKSFRAELKALGGIQIERPDPGDRTPGQLCARARQYGADYMLIDQLSHLEAGHKTLNTKERYGSCLKQLTLESSRPGKELATLVASQLRREDGEPTIQSFADAAEVERDVDMALTLWRNKALRDNHQMKMEVVASRRTEATAYLLEWELSRYTRIRATEEIR